MDEVYHLQELVSESIRYVRRYDTEVQGTVKTKMFLSYLQQKQVEGMVGLTMRNDIFCIFDWLDCGLSWRAGVKIDSQSGAESEAHRQTRHTQNEPYYV